MAQASSTGTQRQIHVRTCTHCRGRKRKDSIFQKQPGPRAVGRRPQLTPVVCCPSRRLPSACRLSSQPRLSCPALPCPALTPASACSYPSERGGDGRDLLPTERSSFGRSAFFSGASVVHFRQGDSSCRSPAVARPPHPAAIERETLAIQPGHACQSLSSPLVAYPLVAYPLLSSLPNILCYPSCHELIT